MGQLSKATQQNASASEELAATSEEMSGQAEQLQQVIGFFNLGEPAPKQIALRTRRNDDVAPARTRASGTASVAMLGSPGLRNSSANFKPY